MITNLDYALTKIENALQSDTLEIKEPLFIKVYTAIKSCIVKGEFPLNCSIPSTRQLSVGLKLSRTTIRKANELLVLEKLMISNIGSGYTVIFATSIKKT